MVRDAEQRGATVKYNSGLRGAGESAGVRDSHRGRAGAGPRPGRSRGCPGGRDGDLRVVRSPGAGRAAVGRHSRGAARPLLRGRPAGRRPAHGRNLQPASALALRLGQRGEGDDPGRAAAQAAAGAQGTHVPAAGAGHGDDHRVRQPGRVAPVGADRAAEPAALPRPSPDGADRAGSRRLLGPDRDHRARRDAPAQAADGQEHRAQQQVARLCPVADGARGQFRALGGHGRSPAPT